MASLCDIIRQDSPVGVLRITGNGMAVTSINFDENGTPSSAVPAYLRPCTMQLQEYFVGTRRNFTFPIQVVSGTDFQREVWAALQEIPYAAKASYGELATIIARPKAVRAVGQANNRNPLCIVVPCHRVVGGNGSLTGYAGGLWRKEWLLEHEARHAA